MLRYTTYIKKDIGFYFIVNILYYIIVINYYIIVVYCIILNLNEYNIYIK